MELNKINVLESVVLDEDYRKHIKPKLQTFNIPQLKYRTIPLTQIYNDLYWDGLRKDEDFDISVMVVDSHHWNWDDSTFAQYLQLLGSVKFSAMHWRLAFWSIFTSGRNVCIF